MTLGLASRQADLFRSTAYREGRVAPHLIYGILDRGCFRLFPDEMFAPAEGAPDITCPWPGLSLVLPHPGGRRAGAWATRVFPGIGAPCQRPGEHRAGISIQLKRFNAVPAG